MKKACCLLLACLSVSVAAVAAPPKRHRTKPKPAPTPPPASVTTEPPIDDPSLVGWWRGDDNGDDETGQNNGSPTAGVTYAPAMNGRGFRFVTGRNDVVIVRDKPSMHLTRSLTISAWVNIDEFPSGGQGKGMILFRGDNRAGLDPYTLYVDSSQQLCFQIESETTQTELVAPIPGRRFLMVTAVLDDATGEMALFENATSVAHTNTVVRPFDQLDPKEFPAIGIGNDNAVRGGSIGYPFHGVINNLRLWKRALTPSEIRALYEDSLSLAPVIAPTAAP